MRKIGGTLESAEAAEKLASIRVEANKRHAAAAKTAKNAGRDFPLFPYEDSWAYEHQFVREWQDGKHRPEKKWRY